MKTFNQILLFFVIFSLQTILTQTHPQLQAQAATVDVKIGIIAPDGTSWSDTLKSMAKEIKSTTNGEVNFRIYGGASQVDELQILRKIRSNQMHGGVFTGKTLGEINGDVRIMEVPFTFYDDRKKAFATMEKLTPVFNDGFAKNKFKNLGFYEIGLVYLVSTRKFENFETLKGVKIWVWEGDKLSEALISSMSLTATPLALQDVLTSLSTGILQATYASPMAIIAMQWQTKVKYLIDFPVTYSIGAFLISEDTWKKIPDKYKKVIEEIAQKHIKTANELIVKENLEALESMKKTSGLTFIKFPQSDIDKGKKIRLDVIAKLQDKLFSKKIVEIFNKEAGIK
ncbi:MAG: TRAP transporter substrate-binding protein DctP [Oligoflexia bacterium]|nr:TRAP transporter substrate-binding protein DctP [Oligoflexia bacterium]